MKIAITSIAILAAVVLFCCMKVGKKADEEMEQLFQEHLKTRPDKESL